MIVQAAMSRAFRYNAALLVLLAGIAWLHIAVALPNHDNSWLLVAAGRLLDGGSYTSDFFEINPPLILLVYLPAVVASRVFGLDPYTGLVLLVLVYTAISVWAVGRIAGQFSREGSIAFSGIPLAVGVVLLVSPGYDFGQREHLIAIFALPYLVLMAATRLGRAAAPSTIVVAAAWAALGLFLKPAYILLPISIAFARLLAMRSPRAFLALDMLTFAILGVAYLALVAFGFPDYFAVVGYAMRLYHAYDGDRLSIGIAATVYGIGAVLPAVVAWKLLPAGRERAPVFLMAGAVLVAGIAVILQNKGWSYHFLPMRIFGGIAAVLGVFAVRRVALERGPSRSIAMLSSLALGILAVALVAPGIQGMTEGRADGDDASGVGLVFEGRGIAMLSPDVPFGFPRVPMAGGEWASRFSCLWLLAGYAEMRNDRSVPPAELDGFAADLRRFMVEDFERYRPEIVAVDADPYTKLGFDILDFYRADPDFAALWDGYRFLESKNGIDIYAAKDQAMEAIR